MPDAAGSLKKAKRRLRAEVLARRNALPLDERERIGRSILERLLTLPETGKARIVMAFASFGSEVPTDPILERLHREGHDLALPVVVGRRIEAVRFQSGDPMAVSALGLREPLSREFLDPSRIDVIVVPGVAFDRDGFRVGYGGGFYDRFLRRTGSSRIGICFSVQLVGEVPHGGTDVSVDALVTEAETLRFGARPQ